MAGINSGLIGTVQPMYGQAGAIQQYRSPFAINTGNPLGNMLLQQGGDMLGAHLLRGTGATPAQMFPTQSFYDQMAARAYFQSQQQVMQYMTQQQTAHVAQMINGASRGLGLELTPQLRQTNESLARGMMPLFGFAAQAGYGAYIDPLFGYQGFAGGFAQQARPGLHFQMDPVTGAPHGSGRSAAFMSNEIFQQLYGTRERASRMHGVTSTSAGELVTSMNSRGLLGTSLGVMDPEERSTVARTFFAGRSGTGTGSVRWDVFDRIAEDRLRGTAISTADLQLLGRTGGTSQEQEQRSALLARARASGGRGFTTTQAESLALAMLSPEQAHDPQAVQNMVRQLTATHAQLATADAATIAQLPGAPGIIALTERRAESDRLFREMGTSGDLMRIPGGDRMLQAADADRIASRVRGMSKTMTAMKELFGQAGLDPNAPMEELMRALEQISQSGFAQKSPAEMERLVRRIQSVADMTGLGVQGVNMMIQHAGALADRFGIDRSFAPEIALQAAASGMGAGDSGMFSVAGYARLDRERYTMMDAQLRASGVASAAGNNAGALRRMFNEGVLRRGTSAEADVLLARLEAGEGVVVDNATLLRIAEGAGADVATVAAYQAGRFENQGAITPEMMSGLRNAQRQESARKFVGGAIERQLSSSLSAAERAALRGVVGDEREFLSRLSGAAGVAVMSSSQEALSDPNVVGTTAAAIRQSMREQFISSGMSEAEADRKTEAAVAAMGGDEALVQAAGGAMSLLGEQARRSGYSSRAAYMQTQSFSPAQLRAEAMRDKAIQTEATVRSALGGMGQGGIVRNIGDALLGLAQGGTLEEALTTALAGDQTYRNVMQRLGPEGEDIMMRELAAMRDMVAGFGADGPTAEQQAALERQAAKVNALGRGGDYARDFLNQYGDSLTPEEKALLERQATIQAEDLTFQGSLEDAQQESRTPGAAVGAVQFPSSFAVRFDGGTLRLVDDRAEVSGTGAAVPDPSLPSGA